MALGIGIGKVQDMGNGRYKILLEKDAKNNSSPISNITFVSGMTHLAYVVIFNVTTPLNTETGIGSRLMDLVGQGGFATNNRIQAILEITQEIKALEERIKMYQKLSPTTLSDDQILRELDVLNIDLDYEAQTVSIELKIYNILGEAVIVEI